MDANGSPSPGGPSPPPPPVIEQQIDGKFWTEEDGDSDNDCAMDTETTNLIKNKYLRDENSEEGNKGKNSSKERISKKQKRIPGIQVTTTDMQSPEPIIIDVPQRGNPQAEPSKNSMDTAANQNPVMTPSGEVNTQPENDTDMQTEATIAPTKSYRQAVTRQLEPIPFADFDNYETDEETNTNIDIDLNEVPDQEIPRVEIPDELLEEIREPWRGSLIVKLLGRTIGYQVLCTKLKTLWNTQGEYSVLDLDNNFFLVKFELPEDAQMVLNGGPWVILNHYLTIRKWEEDFKPIDAKETISALWIRFTGLPVEYYDPRTLRKIANVFGKPLKIDGNTVANARGRFARVSVLVDLNKPLKSRFYLRGKVYTVEYEFLHNLCFYCGRVNHKESECPENPNRKQPTRSVASNQTASYEKGNPIDTTTSTSNSMNTANGGSTSSMAGVQNQDGKELGPSYGPWLLVTRKGRKQNLQGKPKNGTRPYTAPPNNRFQALTIVDEIGTPANGPVQRELGHNNNPGKHHLTSHNQGNTRNKNNTNQNTAPFRPAPNLVTTPGRSNLLQKISTPNHPQKSTPAAHPSPSRAHTPSQVRLDRATATPSWRSQFPEATVSNLLRIHSDHCPLLINMEGTYKLNTDGATKGSQGPSGFGGVLRNNKGGWELGFKGFMGSSTSFAAELQGIYRGLLIIEKHQLKGTILEADCTQVLHVLEDGDLENHLHRDTIVDCIELIRMNEVILKHTFREGNKVADIMANWGVDDEKDYEEIDALSYDETNSPATKLQEAMLADMQGIAFERL